jgi:hypothetical protein
MLICAMLNDYVAIGNYSHQTPSYTLTLPFVGMAVVFANLGESQLRRKKPLDWSATIKCQGRCQGDVRSAAFRLDTHARTLHCTRDVLVLHPTSN